jgi:hypothetical protein
MRPVLYPRLPAETPESAPGASAPVSLIVLGEGPHPAREFLLPPGTDPIAGEIVFRWGRVYWQYLDGRVIRIYQNTRTGGAE